MTDSAPARGLKVSLLHHPIYPLSYSLEVFRTAEELGFHACYCADAYRFKDPWTLLAAAAGATRRIRLGPNATHVFLRDPTLVAQSLATLDELSGGRVEAVVSFGGPALLRRYYVQWQGTRPIERVKEALLVMRSFLDTGQCDHRGQFFRYAALATLARPLQDHLPLMMASTGGRLAMRAAGEVADGAHVLLARSRRAFEYAWEQVLAGARKAGRDPGTLDLAAVLVVVCSEDGEAARELARLFVATYLPILPDTLAELNGIPRERLLPVREAFAQGDVPRMVSLATRDLTDSIAFAGTPDDLLRDLRENVLPSGARHLVLMVVGPRYAQSTFGLAVERVPEIDGQLRLIAERVLAPLGLAGTQAL
ncbi:MAG TPA: LLM class flavin-dependent oxidoreductase [Dehalococcoidia bacterium]|nr:LLM class flavin-dependent oxidoreductase [Dehalococcoidia bacterium]